MRARTASWYETRIKYQKTMEDGSEKVVNELYVVDALSCTEAETSIIEEMSCYISGDSAVTSAKKTNYGEIFFSDLDDDDKWYKAKLQFITIDEKSYKEKRSNVTYLVGWLDSKWNQIRAELIVMNKIVIARQASLEVGIKR